MSEKISNKPYIYMMTNPQGKKYIGQHKGNKKYYRGSGVELDKSFSKKVLLHCERNELDKYEEFYITFYDTYNNGCNRTPKSRGGNNPRLRMTPKEIEEYNERLSKWQKGNPKSHYHRKRLSEAANRRNQSTRLRKGVDTNKIIEMRKSGMTLKAIAEKVNLTLAGVYYRLKKMK